MPLNDLVLRAGVDTQKTQTLNEGGWSTSQFIRFKDGMVQKIGGWKSMDVGPLYGSTRELHAFSDLDGNTYLAGGSEQELWLESAYGSQNITPFRAVTNDPPQFYTTAGSMTVEVQDPAAAGIGLASGEWVNIVTPVYVGGLTIQGLYPVSNVSSGGAAWHIEVASAATSNVFGGGVVAEFSTTAGSASVLVTAPAHGLWTGDNYSPAIPVTVGGITISGTYIITYVSLDAFTIEADPAVSTASAFMNGGDVRLGYLLGNGLNSALENGSYGAGPYGYGPYGIGANMFYRQSVSLWALDNWGEQLIANRWGGGIYVWVPKPAEGNIATVINNAPTTANGIFVSMPARILVALGAETAGIYDPLLIRWSDVEDYNTWTATPTNQAGSFRLSTGNYIVAGVQGSTNAYIWTDLGLWEMKYISTPFIYGFNQIAANCGLAGPHAFAQVSDDLFWMSQRQFFAFNGATVSELTCTVWDEVFQNLNEVQLSKVTAGSNSYFGEVWWFYPSKDSEECDSYVKYNVTMNTWDYGKIDRTAWIDQSVLGAPIAASSVSEIYQHEVGEDDSGLPINAFIESGYLDIASGDQFTYVDQIIPDIKFGIPTSPRNGTVYVTVKMIDFPSDEPRLYGPFPMNKLTPFVTLRARGRQMALRFESDDLGSFWRLGRIRYNGVADGRR